MDKKIVNARMILLCLFLLLPCCATQQDIYALHRQISFLKKEINKISSLREQQAEAGAEMDSVRQELQRVSGSLEENNHLIKHIAERDTADQDNLKQRLAEIEKQVTQLYKYFNLEPAGIDNRIISKKEPELLTKKEDDLTLKPPSDKMQIITSENEIYDNTLALFRKGDYTNTIAGFKNFQTKFPSSKLADNAQFWIGESYMALKQYEQAIVAYQDVIEKYPEGNKVPNAMLKQALAFYEIDDAISSRARLKKIIKTYPNSSEAKIAEAKLNTIK